jgi:hypothetical protein
LIVTEAQQTHARTMPSVVEYDIHGFVGIRLIDPSPRDVSAVSAQLGPDGRLSREPDITIRFVEEVRPRVPLNWIEPHEVGFTDEGYFLFTSDFAAGPVACLRVDGPDSRWEIHCRSGLRSVPLLLPLVDLVMLTRGVLALHASAFTYKDTGVLVAGWARSGKTTSLLGFMARGATYIGDDRVYLHAGESSRLLGLAQPVALRDWHLGELPRYAEIVGWRARSRLRVYTALGRTATRASAIDGLGRMRALARRVAGFADDASVSISPQRLFGGYSLSGRLDKAFLAIAHDSPTVRVEPLEPKRLAERLVFSLRAERLRLWSLYYALSFAFPERVDTFSEEAEALETERLARALEGVESYALYHPFPAPVGALHDALAPVIG